MDKKSKELIRKHKKVRPASSSDSSSSSDSDSGSSSDSYSSSSSDKKTLHRKGKKLRARRSSSSTDEERARKREKHACHRKLEAKKIHLKRKLKEAKAKCGISPSMRRRSISPQKLKKIIPVAGSSAEKKHHQMILKVRMMKDKEREREREKLRANRERMAATTGRPIIKEPKTRSPSKVARCRTSEMKQKSQTNNPDQQQRHQHHQISPREKIIIQARRDRSPSERSKGSKHVRHRLDDRRERERVEAARQKEREEALARCQERQRERERIAREKMMRRDKEFDRDRLLPRPAEREMALAAARAGNSRERSVEPVDVRRSNHVHGHSSRQQRGEIDYDRENYEREREFAGRNDRSLERDDRRGGESVVGDMDRDYLVVRRREVSPGNSGHYSDRQRGSDREIYPDDERYEHDNYLSNQQREHSRSGYIPPIDEPSLQHHRRSERGISSGGNWDQSSHRSEHDGRGVEHHDKHFPENKRDWKSTKDDWDGQHWEEGNNWSSPKQQQSRKKPLPLIQPDENWDEDDAYAGHPAKKPKIDWSDPKISSVGGGRLKHDHVRDEHGLLLPGPHDGQHPLPHQGHLGRRWQPHEWRGRTPNDSRIHGAVGPAPVNFRHGAQLHSHPLDYSHERPDYRRPPQHHHQPHLPHHHPGGYHHQQRPHFPPKRQMTYTNPNLLMQNQKSSQQTSGSSGSTSANTQQQQQHQQQQQQQQQANVSTAAITSTTLTISTNSVTTTPTSNIKSSGIPSLMQSVQPKPNGETPPISRISSPQQQQQQKTINSSATETPEAGEISENAEGEKSSENSNDADNNIKKLESGEIAEESLSGDGGTINSIATADEAIPDDLSEISDEADEILNKDEELAKNLEKTNDDKLNIDEINTSAGKSTPPQNVKDETQTSEIINELPAQLDQTDKDLNDDLLDFEEISDGELEEESRKNLGDALGVDWASLVKDTKVNCSNAPDEQHTTAKQKWQPHRVILDIGISFKFAGEEFAKRILNDAQEKLNAEQEIIKINEMKMNGDDSSSEIVKPEIKVKLEKEEIDDFVDMAATTSHDHNNSENLIKNENEHENSIKNDDNNELEMNDDDEKLSGIACVQVAQRRAKELRKNLIFNACGPNSRALSAQNDLNLRRQLCGFPVNQIDRPHNVSEKLRTLAVQAFQKAVCGEVQ